MAIHLHKNDLPDGVSFSGAIAVDTETLGLKPSRDRLCLVQFRPVTARCILFNWMVKIMTPQSESGFGDRSLVKIFHYARFDLAVIAQYLNVHAAPLWCTKIASKLTRTYTTATG